MSFHRRLSKIATPVAPLVVTLVVTLASLTLYALPAWADHELPTDLCWEGCSPRAEAIVRGFESAGPLAPITAARVHSGICVHRSNDLDMNDAHHGVALFDAKNGAEFFHGQFSFYAKDNPYRDWTPEKAAETLNPKYTESSTLHHESDYAWLDFNPGEIPVWQYYLRQSGNTVYLVGFWGIHHTVFCELDENTVP